MPTFRVRAFLALLAFSLFTLIYVSVGIRWHTYRARASLYAREEMEHTFEAAHYAPSAAQDHQPPRGRPGLTGPRLHRQARQPMHEKAARECTQLREFYEKSW